MAYMQKITIGAWIDLDALIIWELVSMAHGGQVIRVAELLSTLPPFARSTFQESHLRGQVNGGELKLGEVWD
jgi:hypothetical protein